MLKTFLETKKHLYSLIPLSDNQAFPGKLGLLRMKDLLQRLDSPHHKFLSIHVVGTSGKGSTSYLISKIMQEAGLKVGLHISPHLQTMRERLQVNGELISQKDFINLINQIKPIIEQMKLGKYGQPSYFEVLLAAAFLYFAQQRIDLAIVEAGLGGRYDGTNVLNSPVTVVTNIGLDHQQVLGKTKSTILKDKMQIIKPGCYAAITGVKQDYLLKIIKNYCQTQKVPLFVYGKDFKTKNNYSTPNYSQFTFVFKHTKIKDLKLNLAGTFQIDNASLAITASLKLAELRKFKLTNNHIKQALLKAFFPGRLEIVLKKPLTILDGAHNEDKIKALVKSIKLIYPRQKWVIVFGIKKDKNAAKMIKILKPIVSEFIITQFGQATDLGYKLNYPAKNLLPIAKKYLINKKIYLEEKSDRAIQKAQKIAYKRKVGIILTGSLYLVGEARQFFNLKPS